MGIVFGTAIIRVIETLFFHYLRLPRTLHALNHPPDRGPAHPEGLKSARIKSLRIVRTLA
jgi:hypothetical protein